MGEIPSTEVAESENFLVIKDVNPQTKGHSLVLCKEHYEIFLDLPQNLYSELLEITKEATEKIQKETGTKAFNLQSNNLKEAGQEVPHFHLHIIPRT